MEYAITPILFFAFGYFLNMFFITVLYHRTFTHKALSPTKAAVFLTQYVGIFVTGLDPIGWICMHRMHHKYSDTEKDPHSPVGSGIISVFFKQHKSLVRILSRLKRQDPEYIELVKDIPFGVHWLSNRYIWVLPYINHLIIGSAIGYFMASPLVAVCYIAGIASHPIQGWMVNSFGHAKGYRNYDLTDNSKNNTWVALSVFGEGYQNNHHQFPNSPKFSVKWYEIDFGYGMVLLSNLLGLTRFSKITG